MKKDIILDALLMYSLNISFLQVLKQVKVALSADKYIFT